MSALVTTQSEIRLERLLDERDLNTQKHENLLASINAREEKTISETENEHITMYRERAVELDAEIDQLSKDVEATRTAIETSKALRRSMAGAGDGVTIEGDELVYRDFATYARDEILTRQSTQCSMIATQAGGEPEILRARERLQLLKRTPANTLSSNVAGLQPAQHINQIFQVIDKSRPLVAAAVRTTLERGTLTYPSVDTSPVVAVQGTEKTEAGNTGMAVSMVTRTASTYLGGGDLSWQAINWSTPDALQLWFDLAAADYALKTETDAATIVSASAFLNAISSTLTGTPTFAQFMTAIGAGYAKVWTVSGRTADTVVMAPDRFGYILGLTSDQFSQFLNVGQTNVGPLRVVISRGLNSGEIIVGDMSGLLVAETAGAPVELRVVEPAIGGVEVGIIGAFEAAVVDDGAFATITTAS